jgi:hypothetical protein
MSTIYRIASIYAILFSYSYIFSRKLERKKSIGVARHRWEHRNMIESRALFSFELGCGQVASDF